MQLAEQSIQSMHKKRRILAVTGIRSDYDIMVPVYRAIQDHPALDLGLVVTGAHLAKNFGLTVQEIRDDGFPIVEEIESLVNADTKSSRLKGAVLQMAGLIQTVQRWQPDLLLVLGDREEAMSTALVGAYLDVPVAHVCGGDKVIGNVDDVVRHAVTKLAHLHFPTNADSRDRILKLGEEPFRVVLAGNPGLDRFAAVPQLSRDEVFSYLGFSASQVAKPLLVVLQHVLSSEAAQSYAQMRETLEAVKGLSLPTVLIYPNSDAGSQGIIQAIEAYRDLAEFRAFKNIPRLPFTNILRQAACLIGNSSLGLLEAPFLKLPTINVGNRQKGRLHGDNIMFVPHDKAAIRAALETALYDQAFKLRVHKGVSPYGDGRSSARIVETLASIKIDQALLVKALTYE